MPYMVTRAGIACAIALGALRAASAAATDVPCITAAGEGDLARVRAHMRACASEITDAGETALHTAAISGNADVARALIDEGGCDVNARTNGGQYLRMAPLAWWVYGGDKNVEGVAELLRAGADVNARDADGKTAFDMVADGGDFSVKVRELLVKHGGKRGDELLARDEEL